MGVFTLGILGSGLIGFKIVWKEYFEQSESQTKKKKVLRVTKVKH